MTFAPLPDIIFPYDIIYADPPWLYQTIQWDKTGTHSCHDHYAGASNEELATLPVADIAADDSLLFMWAVSPKLDQALTLGTAWGFKYATVAFVWDKQGPVAGNYTMSQCELCLVFKRGRIPKPRGARNVRQFLSQMKGRHSAKPELIMHRIEEMFPTQRKIELFARRKVDGWDGWGNQLADSIRETLI